MAQVLFYIEVALSDAEGHLLDLHNHSFNGLPILFRNEKKAKGRAASIFHNYQYTGFEEVPSIYDSGYMMKRKADGFQVCIRVREVRVIT